jgi:hypothetical protein
MIPKGQLHELIANRVHGELTGQQSMDAVDTLTSDLSLIMNLMWQKRKTDFEKDISHNYEERLQDYKTRVKDLKMTVANLNGRVTILTSDFTAKPEPNKRGRKPRPKKVDATPPPKSYGGKGIPPYGQKPRTLEEEEVSLP